MEPSFIIRVWKYLRQRAGRVSWPVPGWWLVALVSLLVGWRLVWVSGERVRREKIADAFGSVAYLYGSIQPNRAGDKLLFIQTTTNGVGLFLCDTATGERELVTEKMGKDKTGYLGINLWPWSPDGRLFAYTKDALCICRGDTGEALASLDVGAEKPIRLAWLTADSFAYLAPGGIVHLAAKQQGQWRQTPVPDIKATQYSFSAWSSNTLVWNQSNRIWALDLPSQSVGTIYQAPPGQALESFVCSTGGEILLKLRKGPGISIWNLAVGQAAQPVATYPPYFGASDWMTRSNGGFACLPPKGDERFLLVQKDPASKPVKQFIHGHAETLASAADGKRLFVVGVASNEVSEGIWRYDVDADNLQCVVPCTPQPSAYARHIEAMACTLKLATNHLINYYLYPPANFDRRRHAKYPLVIGGTVYHVPDGEHQNRLHGPLWAQALACSGAYVVIVDRPDWFTGLEHWEEDVTAVYHRLAESPTIDTQSVFLFGASAETSPLSALVQKQPELWKGLLLLNPGALPNLAELPVQQPAPNLLISAGAEENREESLKQYQAEALQAGVLAKVVIHPNSTHWLVSVSALRERTQAMVDFVFGD